MLFVLVQATTGLRAKPLPDIVRATASSPAPGPPEPLKNQFGPAIPEQIAAALERVWPSFGTGAFMRDVLEGYGELNLMARAAKIAAALRRHLPADYEVALGILLQSLGPMPAENKWSGELPFFHLPHTTFVASYGLEHFEASMRAQYELTQRFTAEFSIRPFLERHPEATLERLRLWAEDPSLHVRRLVSEGTRPRLPWASRLRAFQKDPRLVLALLEKLKDDPELYVRRSVANNLNDIGKDHPSLLVETAERWLAGAPAGRAWVVRHALRSAVKRGEAEALRVLGFGAGTSVILENACIQPATVSIGGAVTLSFELLNLEKCVQKVMVDFRVHFVKAGGRVGPKVFKLRAVQMEVGERLLFRKRVSLAALTTRRHYPGSHRVEALLNGEVRALGSFELMA
jgi:3-methyladenine DNA glycosylase AlkC